ncbi:hypothetical protein BDN72DRAFT_286614 [Pluteus cervinus]|uniref:Uncharacterized protein n=1 Tax=Pluteus cervinus TaxID=181527 RepID=A0ACD3ADU8_9AGAR|nr:hypothetical protein BDN72DRAFT_286614 [Pluteus cervinus]
MVHLVLSSTKGNQGLRYFPHSGYLGLTPVKVEGIVKTKLDDDLKTLQAKSITISVRCYEARLGRVSVVHSNILVDHTTTLWSKPDDADYAPIGDLEFPFKIVVPTKTAGFSTAVFVDYRCSWRVEAIINHIPISGIGSRQIRHFELPLVRYDLPPYQPTPASPPPLADLPSPSSPSSVKSPYARSPRFQFSINPPTDPIGPHDLVSIPVQLLPLDPSISIRSVSASIDRRITLCPDPPTPPTSPTSNGTSSLAILRASPSPSPRSCSPASSYKEPSAFPNDSNPSITSFDSSASTITPDTLAPSHSSAALLSSDVPMEPSSSTSPSQHPPSKIISNVITTAEASGSLTRDEKGVWSRILTLQWPPPKPNSRWATGETIQSELVNVQFFARVKVCPLLHSVFFASILTITSIS